MINKIYDILDNTNFGVSALSNEFIEKIRGNTGRYQCHLLNNVCSGEPKYFLGVGVCKNTYLASVLHKTQVDATFALFESDYNESQFRGAIQKVDTTNSKYTIKPTRDVFKNMTHTYDVVYLGNYATSSLLLDLVPYMSDNCIIIIDNYKQKGRNYKSLLQSLPLIHLQNVISKYHLEENMNPKMDQFNKSTWWDGLIIAVLDKK